MGRRRFMFAAGNDTLIYTYLSVTAMAPLSGFVSKQGRQVIVKTITSLLKQTDGRVNANSA